MEERRLVLERALIVLTERAEAIAAGLDDPADQAPKVDAAGR